ncbi:hypothetical protein [Labilibaculum euxinus]
MKKLELKQMEKANGGDACSRYKNRFYRMKGRGNDAGATRMYEKALSVPCDYSN